MRRAPWKRIAVWGAAALGALALLAGLLQPGPARGSALSRGSGGWLAARRYLEGRGAGVSILGRPLDRFEGSGVLVVAFPIQHGGSLRLGDRLSEHLRRGGTLLLGYSGDRTDASEIVAMTALGVELEEARRPSLNPLRWRRSSRLEWELAPPGGGDPGDDPVRVWAPRWIPAEPAGAEVLLEGPGGEAVAFCAPAEAGRLCLLPTDALSNARLGGAGNADLLETLFQRLGERWAFDEYHHGLVAARPGEEAGFQRSLDLILIHLAVLYAAAVASLARRFGPPWSEPPATVGSTRTFLVGLGRLHHRLGHHAEAARRLLDRVRELEPGLPLPEEPAGSAGPERLTAVAAAVARARRGGRPPDSREPVQREEEG